MKLSLLLVNYNTVDLLRNCINSIVKEGGLSSKDYEIIIVDNGSTDGSREYLKNLEIRNPKVETIEENKGQKSQPEASTKGRWTSGPGRPLDEKFNIKVIFNKENLGFAKANNLGIKRSLGKYVMLLNSDTIIKDQALKKMVEWGEGRTDEVAIAPQLLNSDGTIQASVYHIPSLRGAWREFWRGEKGTFSEYVPRGKKPIAVEAVVGAALLVPRGIFKKIGLLDERFFFYFEDLDFCRRINRAGFKVYYLPQVHIVHFLGASGKKIGSRPNHWLIESSQKFHGLWRHKLINLVIWSGQLWPRLKKHLFSP